MRVSSSARVVEESSTELYETISMICKEVSPSTAMKATIATTFNSLAIRATSESRLPTVRMRANLCLSWYIVLMMISMTPELAAWSRL